MHWRSSGVGDPEKEKQRLWRGGAEIGAHLPGPVLTRVDNRQRIPVMQQKQGVNKGQPRFVAKERASLCYKYAGCKEGREWSQENIIFVVLFLFPIHSKK